MALISLPEAYLTLLKSERKWYIKGKEGTGALNKLTILEACEQGKGTGPSKAKEFKEGEKGSTLFLCISPLPPLNLASAM